MPLPLTVTCFSEIQTGFTFLVPVHPGSPGQRTVKRVSLSIICQIDDGLKNVCLKFSGLEKYTDYVAV